MANVTLEAASNAERSHNFGYVGALYPISRQHLSHRMP